MKATEAKLLDFLKKSPQFVIPIYQRTYSWTEKECRQLWDDILRAGSSENISVHFVGSIVYIEDGLSTISHSSPLLVIDGQQRLTTATLLIAALADAVGDGEPIDGFSAEMLRGYYLLNPLEKGDRKFKLLLSQNDRDTLSSIVANRDLPAEPSQRVVQNYELFKELLAGVGENLADICSGIAKLVVVDVALSREHDNPQLIFESMNSTGKELSQADLIRNYVLMGLEPELQTELYEQYWRPMEQEFGLEGYSSLFDSFMRHYLTVRTGEIPRLRDVYERFKEFATQPDVQSQDIQNLVKDIRDSANYFCNMALGHEKDKELGRAFRDLRELRVEVAFPLLLELYADYVAGQLTKEDLLETIRTIEAYVFRRAVCAIPTNSMNKTFANFGKALKKDRYLESIKAQFLLLPSYRRFPTDEEFVRELCKRDLYNFRSRSYWLRRIENFKRKELVSVGEYTIEHIMPQNENLSTEWREELGADWQRVHETWLHTLGNLTLTAYNSEFSDRPFAFKRDMPNAPEKGLKQSPLKLNIGLGIAEQWNESAIKDRADRLSELALEVWKAPSLSKQELVVYRPTKPSNNYSLDDHSNLKYAKTKRLFEACRSEILALDTACVTEEILKFYIAYKAETNFVDIIAKSRGLRFILNMKFADVDDPKGMCRDITKLGRWGNGNVEFDLKEDADIPYAIGLVRQSLDLQLGDGASE